MYAPEVDPDVFQKVNEVMHPFELSMEDYMDIKNALLAALRSGLKLKRRDKSSVKMYPSYVTKMPTGEGKFTHLLNNVYRVWTVSCVGSWWNKFSRMPCNSFWKKRATYCGTKNACYSGRKNARHWC